MGDPSVSKGGNKPTAPNGARNRSEARFEGERTEGRADLESHANDRILAEEAGHAESAGAGAFDLMNKTLRRMHKMQPKHRHANGEI
jgi:hypothetical protein